MPYEAWRDTCQTLHLWTQIVGKVRLELSPFLNHWWHVALYVNPRGLTTSGAQQARLQGHRGLVMCVAWSLDGTRLASGGGGRGSGELFVWDARSGAYLGEPLYVLRERSEIVYALAWSPTGAMLIGGGSDGMLRWWDVERGECVQTREAHREQSNPSKRVPMAACSPVAGTMALSPSGTSRVASICAPCGAIAPTSASLSRASGGSPKHKRRRCARWVGAFEGTSPDE